MSTKRDLIHIFIVKFKNSLKTVISALYKCLYFRLDSNSMKKLLIGLLLFVACFSLSSCFDIVEEIDMKANGSGTIKGTLNLSKSKTKAASLMKLDKIDGFKIPSESEIRKEVNTMVNLLKNTKGISNVNYRLDFNNYIASISCDFQNVQALNAYTKTLGTHFKSRFNENTSYAYDTKTKTFVRSYKHSAEAKKEFSKLQTENRKSFDQAFYTSIYRFDRSVAKQASSVAKVSPNKKAVMLKTSIPSLISGQVNLANSIVLQ